MPFSRLAAILPAAAVLTQLVAAPALANPTAHAATVSMAAPATDPTAAIALAVLGLMFVVLAAATARFRA